MILGKETYAINGAAMEVHRQLGCGFLEKVYQAALEKEFIKRGIPYEREKPLRVFYDNEPIADFCADFVCYGSIIVELKAVKALEDIHKAQLLNYMYATGMKVGLLINFGEMSLTYERFANER